MSTEDVRTHGVREAHQNQGDDDYAVEQIRTIGYTVIDTRISDEELDEIRTRIDAVYDRQVRELGGEASLAAINDADVARCLIGYDDYFLTLATHPRLIAICEKLLGPAFCLMSQNAIINRPAGAHYQVTWHRDLNYQHWVSSRPLGISALYAIDAFSDETGGTRLLPASHKVEAFPSAEYVEHHQVTVDAKPGAMLVFDAMLYHRSGVNRSGRVRRAVNHIVTPPLIKQQISIPHMLRGKYEDDPFLRTFLGYDSQTGDDVQQWRERKLGLAGRATIRGHAVP